MAAAVPHCQLLKVGCRCLMVSSSNTISSVLFNVFVSDNAPCCWVCHGFLCRLPVISNKTPLQNPQQNTKTFIREKTQTKPESQSDKQQDTQTPTSKYK